MKWILIVRVIESNTYVVLPFQHEIKIKTINGLFYILWLWLCVCVCILSSKSSVNFIQTAQLNSSSMWPEATTLDRMCLDSDGFFYQIEDFHVSCVTLTVPLPVACCMLNWWFFCLQKMTREYLNLPWSSQTQMTRLNETFLPFWNFPISDFLPLV